MTAGLLVWISSMNQKKYSFLPIFFSHPIDNKDKFNIHVDAFFFFFFRNFTEFIIGLLNEITCVQTQFDIIFFMIFLNWNSLEQM